MKQIDRENSLTMLHILEQRFSTWIINNYHLQKRIDCRDFVWNCLGSRDNETIGHSCKKFVLAKSQFKLDISKVPYKLSQNYIKTISLKCIVLVIEAFKVFGCQRVGFKNKIKYITARELNSGAMINNFLGQLLKAICLKRF